MRFAVALCTLRRGSCWAGTLNLLQRHHESALRCRPPTRAPPAVPRPTAHLCFPLLFLPQAAYRQPTASAACWRRWETSTQPKRSSCRCALVRRSSACLVAGVPGARLLDACSWPALPLAADAPSRLGLSSLLSSLVLNRCRRRARRRRASGACPTRGSTWPMFTLNGSSMPAPSRWGAWGACLPLLPSSAVPVVPTHAFWRAGGAHSGAQSRAPAAPPPPPSHAHLLCPADVPVRAAQVLRQPVGQRDALPGAVRGQAVWGLLRVLVWS